MKDKELEKTRPWRDAVGGMWDTIGALQFDFLVRNGLQSQHRFLDVGCGSLRGGIHFIRYLNDGLYCGIDQNKELLDAGVEKEVPLAGLSHCTVNLAHNAEFDFSTFNTVFDFALAQSVFSHLPEDTIAKCLIQMEKVLTRKGKFYASFFEIAEQHEHGKSKLHDPGGITTYPDRDPYHYSFSQMQQIGLRASLKCNYIGGWNHPRNQMMLCFERLEV